MNNIKNNLITILLALSFVLMFGALAISINTNTTLNKAQEAIEQMDTNDNVDTKVIEVDFGLGFEGSKVRMLCGWMYDENTIEDQFGNLWSVESELSENDFLLLWIDDNGTADDVSDDSIVQMWREVL